MRSGSLHYGILHCHPPRLGARDRNIYDFMGHDRRLCQRLKIVGLCSIEPHEYLNCSTESHHMSLPISFRVNFFWRVCAQAPLSIKLF